MAHRSQNLRTSEPQNLRISESQNLRTSEPSPEISQLQETTKTLLYSFWNIH